MTGVEQIKNFTLKIKSELNKRGGKLFVCESDKYLAASAVVGLTGGDSTVVVAHDLEVANDYREVFGLQSQEVTVVSDCGFMERALRGKEGGNATDKDYSACARSFAKRFPKLIVPVFDREGAPLFNGVLTDVTGKEGEYLGSTTPAKYCVSDFLAECGYDCVIVDDVYSTFEFTKADGGAMKESAQTPHLYDCMSFMDGWYFTELSRSYSRLKKLCSRASKRILLSDVIVRRNLIELFAAADILRVADSRENALREIRNFEKRIETVCADFRYDANDDEVTMELMSLIKDCTQKKPDNQEKLSEYMNTCFHYMTKFDIFDKIVRAHAANKYGGSLSNPDAIIEDLGEGNNSAKCLNKMFFDDALKGLFESEFSDPHVCKLNDTGVATLFKIFDSIGFLESYRYDCDMLDTIRLMRDDSGYEAFVENHASFNQIKKADVDETEFSVIGRGSDLLYECALCARLVTDNIAGQCSLPTLLVVKENTEKILDAMHKLLPNVECTGDFQKVSGSGGLIVTDFERLVKSARPLNVKTVVFFGMVADPQRMCSILNKALGARNTRGIIITRHGDLSGRISAKWNYVAERNDNFVLPIGTDEIEYKTDKFCSYDNAVAKINSVYVTLKATAEGRVNDAETLASWLTTLETDYLSDSVLLNNVIAKKDFEYLSRIGKTYEDVFASSVSAGRSGEEIRVTDEKSGNTVSDSGKVLFNTCARYLSRSCDGITVDCKTCPERKKFEINSWPAFCSSVEDFFTETKDYANSRDVARQKELDERQIHGGGEQTKELTEKAVDEGYKRYSGYMNRAYPHVNAFDESFNLALASKEIIGIRNTVTDVYALAIERYHNRIVQIFDKVSEKVKVRYEELLRKQ